MMLARANTKPRRQNSHRADVWKRAPQFLQWLRGRNCVCAGPSCQGRMEAAHVDYAGSKGIGTKVHDRFAVPMCSAHHAEQHRVGWTPFEAATRINALRLANDFWSAWPGRRAWENAHGE